MSPRKKSHFVGLILEPSIFCPRQQFFESFQSDSVEIIWSSIVEVPWVYYWLQTVNQILNGIKKIDTQDFLAGSLHKIWSLNHGKKGNLAASTPSMSTYELQDVLQNYSGNSKCTFPSRITFTRLVWALKKINWICPSHLAVNSFRIWDKKLSKLEPLDRSALWETNFDVEKQSTSVGSGTEQASFWGCFNLRAA